jgi:hypothetical protein
MPGAYGDDCKSEAVKDDDCKSEAVKDQVLCGTLKAWQHFPYLQRRSARREGSRCRTRVTHQGGGTILVSDRQLRIVAAAADLLPVESRDVSAVRRRRAARAWGLQRL